MTECANDHARNLSLYILALQESTAGDYLCLCNICLCVLLESLQDTKPCRVGRKGILGPRFAKTLPVHYSSLLRSSSLQYSPKMKFLGQYCARGDFLKSASAVLIQQFIATISWRTNTQGNERCFLTSLLHRYLSVQTVATLFIFEHWDIEENAFYK